MNKLRVLAVVIVSLGIGLQLLPYGKHSNPVAPVEQRFDRHLKVNAEVNALLRRACLDCHSNDTQWPWYSSLAPISWMMSADVERGRRVMNFSEWSSKAGRRPELAASMLMAACSTAKAGRMPRFPYSLLHPEAKLSPVDLQVLCDWTNAEARRLLLERRRASAASAIAR